MTGTIPLTSANGELKITGDLTINGPGANRLTVSGSNATRVFDISGGTVTIAGLTIAQGSTTGTGDPNHPSDLGGGGILNQGGASLTLDHSTLTDNTATALSHTVDVFGGGLLNEGTATVISCTFSNNKALEGGGTSFFGNDFFGGSVGGAIDNFEGATLTVTDSTFINNQGRLGATVSSAVYLRVAGRIIL